MAELYPEQFARWLFGASGVTVEKTELSREPVRADAVILAHGASEICHIEFQTTLKSEAPLPLRMLDYYVGLKRENPLREIRQALVLLKPTRNVIPGQYVDTNTEHRYQVVKLWEVEAAEVMRYEGLLPLATLCRATAGPAALLREVAEQVQRGEARGLQKQRQLVLRLLERVTGQVPPRARQKIEKFGFDQLAQLGEALLDFKSGKELNAWLKQHTAR